LVLLHSVLWTELAMVLTVHQIAPQFPHRWKDGVAPSLTFQAAPVLGWDQVRVVMELDGSCGGGPLGGHGGPEYDATHSPTDLPGVNHLTGIRGELVGG
jgi:hypothetical protein